MQLNKLGVGLQTCRARCAAANANRPKGEFIGQINSLGNRRQ